MVAMSQSHQSEPESLSAAEMDEIDAMHARLGENYYDFLGVPKGCDRVRLRSAYFEHMKRFHPDVYWERDLGLYRPRVEAIHQRLTRAFEVLSNDRRREEYDRALLPATAVAPERPRSTGIMARPAALDPAAPPAGTRAGGAVIPANPTPVPRTLSSPVPRAIQTPVPRPKQTPVPQPMQTPVPREITMQSLLRGRSEHMMRERREQGSAFEDRIRQASIRNDRAEVLSLLRQAAAAAPDDAGLRARLEAAEAEASTTASERYATAARIHERDKRWGNAAEAWIKVASERPKDVAVLLAVVNASCEGLIDLQRAAEYGRRATLAAPGSADAFAALGRVFFLAGRMASARGAVESALKLDASHAAALDLARRLKVR